MREVIKRDDGFFGVSGQPDTVYYQSAEHAQRIAANLDLADEAAEEAAADAEEAADAAACADGDLVEPE